MISAIELKRCVIGTGIFGIIIGKLSHWYEPCPVILLEVDKGLEISFYCTILLLGLVVYLQVKSGGESSLNILEVA